MFEDLPKRMRLGVGVGVVGGRGFRGRWTLGKVGDGGKKRERARTRGN